MVKSMVVPKSIDHLMGYVLYISKQIDDCYRSRRKLSRLLAVQFLNALNDLSRRYNRLLDSYVGENNDKFVEHSDIVEEYTHFTEASKAIAKSKSDLPLEHMKNKTVSYSILPCPPGKVCNF